MASLNRSIGNRLTVTAIVTIVAAGSLAITWRQYSPRRQYGRFVNAASSGDIAAVRTMLSAGADVNGLPYSTESEGVAPLEAAAGSGKIEVVKLLIDRGANIDFKDGWGMSALRAASNEGQLRIVQLLIGRGAKINDFPGDSSALSDAIATGHKDIARELVRAGAKLAGPRR